MFVVVVVVVFCVCVCVVFGVLSLIPSEVLELLIQSQPPAYLLSIVRMNSNNIVNRGYCCDWKLIMINNYDKIGT